MINYGVIVTIANKYANKMIRNSGFNGSLRFFKFQNYFDTFDCLVLFNSFKTKSY